jgi:hypothetical protein
MKKKYQPLKLDLQLFAEGGAEGGEGGEAEAGETVITSEQLAEQIEAAKESVRAGLQAEYESKLAEQLEAGRTEAEKLSKMTADEKREFEYNKRLEDLQGKEQQLAARELQAEATKILGDKGLPSTVLDFVLAQNAEDTAKRIDNFKQVFDVAVQAGVEQRLQGKTPRAGAAGVGTKTSTEQLQEQFNNALGGARQWR